MSTTIHAQSVGSFVTVACGPMLDGGARLVRFEAEGFRVDHCRGHVYMLLSPETAREVAAALLAHAPLPGGRP